jgi:hypothetical protein
MALPLPIISRTRQSSSIITFDKTISSLLYSTGDALETADAYTGEADVSFGSSFCPFLQSLGHV